MPEYGWGLRTPPSAMAAEYERRGLWSGLTMNELLPRTISRWPWLPAVVQGETELGYGELGSRVDRAAAFLSSRGIGRGDIVCWQLPNWWESLVVALAIWQVGAVSSPIVTIYREVELTEILRQLRPAAVITCARFRSVAHAELFEDCLRAADVHPRCRLVVRGQITGWAAFDDIAGVPAAGFRSGAGFAMADDPCLILFTSGTTGHAKGVVHTSRSLLAEVHQMSTARGFTWEDVSYMPAPLAHVSGLLIGLTVPIAAGGSVVLEDLWDPERACQTILSRGVTFSAGSVLFLRELAEAARTRHTRLDGLRSYACGGATMNREVIEQAHEIGIPAMRAYGLSELPTVTMPNRSQPWADLTSTDGPIGEGVEVSIRDSAGSEVAPGNSGEIFVRGPERMAGYIDEADSAEALDGEGWLRTGDLGWTRDGLVTITGRVKDIINRGGEKFSCREIEDALLTYRGVHAVVVVAAPDQRFGEVPAAWLVVDGAIEATQLIAHLTAAGLARQKVPVFWRIVDELPLTASGKVKRSELISRLGEGQAG